MLSLTIYYYILFILGDVQSSFIPPEMPIVYPMFSSTRMNQEIQVEKMRRNGKDATSSQAPQVSSMIHGMSKTTILIIFFLSFAC